MYMAMLKKQWWYCLWGL